MTPLVALQAPPEGPQAPPFPSGRTEQENPFPAFLIMLALFLVVWLGAELWNWIKGRGDGPGPG